MPYTPSANNITHRVTNAIKLHTFCGATNEVLGWRLKPHPQDVVAMIACPYAQPTCKSHRRHKSTNLEQRFYSSHSTKTSPLPHNTIPTHKIVDIYVAHKLHPLKCTPRVYNSGFRYSDSFECSSLTTWPPSNATDQCTQPGGKFNPGKQLRNKSSTTRQRCRRQLTRALETLDADALLERGTSEVR